MSNNSVLDQVVHGLKNVSVVEQNFGSQPNNPFVRIGHDSVFKQFAFWAALQKELDLRTEDPMVTVMVMVWLFGQGPEKEENRKIGVRMREEKVYDRTYDNRHTAGRFLGCHVNVCS